MGIRAVIGSSFGDIFFANCFQNGILPIIVDKEIVDSLAADVQQTQGAGRISIDLQQQTIISPSGSGTSSRSIRAVATACWKASTKSRRRCSATTKSAPFRRPTGRNGPGSTLQRTQQVIWHE